MKRWLLILLFLPVLCQATMMGTRPLLRGAVQNQLDFDSAKSDTFLINNMVWNEFINRASIQVADDFDCVEKQLQIITTVGTQSYIVDSALLKILWTLRSTPRYSAVAKHVPVPYMKEFYDDTLLSRVQSPRLFWEHDDSVKFYPTPNKVDTFLVGYSIYPAYLNSDTLGYYYTVDSINAYDSYNYIDTYFVGSDTHVVSWTSGANTTADTVVDSMVVYINAHGTLPDYLAAYDSGTFYCIYDTANDRETFTMTSDTAKVSILNSLTCKTNIPLEYREAIVFYTCYLFKLLIKEYTEAELLHNEYDKILVKYKAKQAAKYDLPLRGGG